MDLRIFNKHRSIHANIAAPNCFDPYSDKFLRDPYSTYTYLREFMPVFYWVEGNAWIVSRYKDVVFILNDPRFESRYRYLADMRGGNTGPEEISGESYSDSIENYVISRARVDKFIAMFFSTQKIDLLHSTIANIVNEQLNQLQDRFDVVKEYSNKVAVRVLASVLGVPEKHLLIFAQFCKGCLDIYYRGSELSHDEKKYYQMHVDIGLVLIRQTLNERRSLQRREYLIDLILSYSPKGELLSDSEVMGFAIDLILNCLEPMSQLISGSIYSIFKSRKSIKFFQRHDGLWSRAVLESLRHDYFIKLDNPKYAMEDCYIGDQRIARGEKIYPLAAAALRDPDLINNPDSFDAMRSQPDLLEYGYRENDYVGRNLLIKTAEIAVAGFFKLKPSVTINSPEYDSTHKNLRFMSSLIGAVS